MTMAMTDTIPKHTTGISKNSCNTQRRSPRVSTILTTEKSTMNAIIREERRLGIRNLPNVRREESNHLLDETKLRTQKGTTDTVKAMLEDDLSSLEDEVQSLVGGTSEKFVPQPSRDDVISDIVNGLRRFKDVVRWKDFHRLQHEEKEKRWSINNNIDNLKFELNNDDNTSKGLKTGLKATKVNLSAPRASEKVETFLHTLETTLLDQAFNYNERKANCKISSTIKTIQKRLMDKPEVVIIPTDKTNSFRIVPTTKYERWVEQHLLKYGKVIPRATLTEVMERALELLEEKRDILSDKEAEFLHQSINSKAIPSPKLLIKDHKKADKNGDFQTRLVVPANNFTSAFPKLGYLGIKKILDENNIDYASRTIIQASDLKQKLENMDIRYDNSTIISIDAVDYYPSIKFKLVKKAVYFFSKDLNDEDQMKIEDCLDMIKFGMSSTLLTFVDKYFEYDGDSEPDEKGLTIGGYESAWLADLVGAFILANTKQMFAKAKFYGLYRDDGFCVFKGRWSYEEIVKWRNDFQRAVNKLAGGTFLQFTCSMWWDISKIALPESEREESTSIVEDSKFPYLDMELFWSEKGELKFQVHLKPNQKLKYLNKGSAHTNACFKAIPSGIFNRLAKLTSMNNMNANSKLDAIYPQHFRALRKANLISDKIPTLKEELLRLRKKDEMKVARKATKEKTRNADRATYFCVGYSKAWLSPVHKTIKEIKDKFKLSWLRVSMSYHRFTNLREIFQGDLSRKLTLGVISKDFETLDCNCRLGAEQKCGYNGFCRKSIIVYKVECKNTSKIYIGNTQQHFKKRMQQHFNDVRKLHSQGDKSDSYAKHFAEQFLNFESVSPNLQRGSISCSILWQGNPINVVKTFGTTNCALCNKERIEILKQSKKDPKILINSCNEIYGACRHKPRFHRYKSRTPSTDESLIDEKVTPTNLQSTTSESIPWCSKCLTEV
jgi:GIY-YIG catalytic domain